MNPLTSETPKADIIVNETKAEIKKEEKFIGSIRPHKGHTIYEVNIKERTIEKAVFDEIKAYKAFKDSKGLGLQTSKDGSKKVVLDGLANQSRKLKKKKDCIYVSALNRKNLIKKLIKMRIMGVKVVKK